MENSNALIVAGKGETIPSPVSVQGIIRRVTKLTSKAEEHAGKVWVSMEIEGLPDLADENGDKVTIVRTLKQAYNDLDLLAPSAMSLQGVLVSFARYAKNKPVTLEVSAHTKGAKLTVTPESSYHTNNGGKFKTGETATLDNAGFYVEGFLDIEYSNTDLDNKLAQIEKATQEAEDSAM